MILTWILVGTAVALFVLGTIYAWRNRPARDMNDPDGEQKYLSAFNITNAKDFGFYKRPRD